MALDAALCRLSRWDGDPANCQWCNWPLEGAQRRWCSRKCASSFWDHHLWARARICVLVRDGGRCVICGSDDRVEVDHIRPRRGRGYSAGCAHHHRNLETLCHHHHCEKTATEQRRPGVTTQLTLIDAA